MPSDGAATVGSSNGSASCSAIREKRKSKDTKQGPFFPYSLSRFIPNSYIFLANFRATTWMPNPEALGLYRAILRTARHFHWCDTRGEPSQSAFIAISVVGHNIGELKAQSFFPPPQKSHEYYAT